MFRGQSCPEYSLSMTKSSDSAAAHRTSDEELLEFWSLAYESFYGTHRRLVEELKEKTDLPEPWVHLMLRLLRTPDNMLPMTSLAQELSMSSGGFTKLADRLEDAGLIERQPGKGDRRKVFAVLTQSGVDITQRALRVQTATLRQHLLGRVTSEELAQMSRTMRLLTEE